jgi:hypothetical protein
MGLLIQVLPMSSFHNKVVCFWMKVMQYQHISKYDESICCVGVHNE